MCFAFQFLKAEVMDGEKVIKVTEDLDDIDLGLLQVGWWGLLPCGVIDMFPGFMHLTGCNGDVSERIGELG